MSLPNYKKFPGFKITFFVADPGVLEFIKKSVSSPINLEIEAFLRYRQAVDFTHNKEVEQLEVKPGSKIILPCSKNGDCAKVCYAGAEPDFRGLDANNNLEAVIPADCCIRVEFGGIPGKKKVHVKFFKTV